MGILKGCLKLVGSAALVATGAASTVLKGFSDTVGAEGVSELLGAAKDASFNGLRGMWDGEVANKVIDTGESASYKVEDATRSQMASTAYRMAQIAKQNGDMEKYETYMEKYHQYK